ncbi:MAG: hypothetical protein E6G53_08205 [Actinobacteria bacterium]|nr:MAG: hypothetical protein E6G53_08205 [Actinomycetota bacterium]
MLDDSRANLRCRARPLAATLLACGALAALPAAGQATEVTLGSDLTKPADVVEDHGADAVFWPITIDGTAGAVPTSGQVNFVRIKGSVLADPSGRAKPDPLVHIQVLHPIGRGAVRVSLSSGGLRLPVGGNPQAITTFKPVNLCVKKGDYVAFNDIGGFEWRWGNYAGMPFQVFSRTTASTTNYYTRNAGTMNGAQFSPMGTLPVELLMQYKLGTGPDAVSICGGYKQYKFKGVGVRRETVSVGGGRARIHLACQYRTFGSCRGVVVVKGTVNGKQVTFGGTPFIVQPAYVSSVYVSISSKNAGLIRKAGGVTASVVMDGHDDPRHDRKAPRGTPVQKKTTTGKVRLTG